MKNFLMLLALGLVLSLGSGCAASLSPVPGMSVGFDLAPDNFGVGVEMNPLVTGCTVAGVISWNWAENMFCKEGFVDVAAIEANESHKFVNFALRTYDYSDSTNDSLVWNEDTPLTNDGRILFDFDPRGSTLYEGGTESISFEVPEMVLFPRN